MLRSGARTAVERLLDPLVMVPMMHLVDREGRFIPFHQVMTLEQWEVLQSIRDHRRVYVLKARKLGISTLGSLFFLHRSATHPTIYNTVAMGHEEGACKTINKMWQTAFRGLTTHRTYVPGGLGLPFSRGETWGTEILTINRGPGPQPALAVLQAGGRGGGRSFTFHGAHFTEGAFYPQGSSATGHSGKDAEEGADEAAVASVLSSMHDDEHARVLWETTANGPRGYNWRLFQLTQRPDSGWKFHFFPWHRLSSYKEPVPPGFEVRDDEKAMMELHGIPLEGIVWRRNKLERDGYTLNRFRKEYPLTPMDPFLVGTAGWFDVELLNALLGAADPQYYGADGWRVYHEPHPRLRHWIGLDPSGGTGRDQATCVVLREDGEIAAVFSSRRHGPHQLAEEVAPVAQHYGARVLCEANNHGFACITRLQELGVRLYVTDNGKPLWVTPVLKRAMADWARVLVNAGHVRPYDPVMLQELLVVREQKSGNIEADAGSNDDHFSGLYLACWNARDGLTNVNTEAPAPGVSSSLALQRGQVTEARRRRVVDAIGREV